MNIEQEFSQMVKTICDLNSIPYTKEMLTGFIEQFLAGGEQDQQPPKIIRKAPSLVSPPPTKKRKE